MAVVPMDERVPFRMAIGKTDVVRVLLETVAVCTSVSYLQQELLFRFPENSEVGTENIENQFLQSRYVFRKPCGRH